MTLVSTLNSRSRVWYSAQVTWRTAWISAIGAGSATGDIGDSIGSSRPLSLGAVAAATGAGTGAEALWSSPMTFSTHRLTSGSLLCAYLFSNTLRTSWTEGQVSDFQCSLLTFGVGIHSHLPLLP